MPSTALSRGSQAPCACLCSRRWAWRRSWPPRSALLLVGQQRPEREHQCHRALGSAHEAMLTEVNGRAVSGSWMQSWPGTADHSSVAAYELIGSVHCDFPSSTQPSARSWPSSSHCSDSARHPQCVPLSIGISVVLLMQRMYGATAIGVDENASRDASGLDHSICICFGRCRPRILRMFSAFGSVDHDLFLDCSPYGITLCLGCTRLCCTACWTCCHHMSEL